jgi:6-phosphofructokinase 2
MYSIITITFNPAIDKTTSIKALIPEKKLQCSIPKLEPGGGGVNVARAIKKIGGEALAIYLGGGYNGSLMKELLNKEQVASLQIETKNPARENIIVLDNSTNLQYRFGMPGPEIYEAEWQQCIQEIEKAEGVQFIVASGSLPPGVPENIFATIAAIAKNKNAKFVVDTSEKALQLAVKEGVYLLKPNLGELSSLAGGQDLNVESVKEVAQKIIAEGKCEVMVVSMGAAGAMLVTKNEATQISAPPVKKKSTVGAGDSMLAGIVYSLSQGKTLLEAAQYGVACGTAATMNPGTELCHLNDVENLYAALRR